MNEESIKANIILDQSESIKLMKMSKGFQWEIKLLADKDAKMLLSRLKEINDVLVNEYGSLG